MAEKEKVLRTFNSRAEEELYHAGRQFWKTLFLIVVLAIILYITHFLSAGWTVLFAIIGFLMLLITVTYSVGHFVRFLLFRSRNQ